MFENIIGYKELKEVKTGWKPKKSSWTKEEIAAHTAEHKRKLMIDMSQKSALVDAVLSGEGVDRALETLPPHVIPALNKVASLSDSQKSVRLMMTAALVSASVTLSRYKLVVGLPPVIKHTELKQKERKKNLKYVINDFPRLKVPENYDKAAMLFRYMNFEAATSYLDYMRLVARQKGIPMIALTSADLKTPFPPDFFKHNPSDNKWVNAGEAVRDVVVNFGKNLSGVNRLYVLWGDSGKMVKTLGDVVPLGITIVIVSALDHLTPHYEKYLSFIEGSAFRRRCVLFNYGGLMKDFVQEFNMNGHAVVANYVDYNPPDDFKPLRLLQVLKDYRTHFRDKKVVYIPPGLPTKVASRHIQMFSDVHKHDVIHMDPLGGIVFTHDTHEVWADVVHRQIGVIPLSEYMRVSADCASYKGSLCLKIGVWEPDVTMEGIVVNPIKMSADALDMNKMFTFDADELSYIDYIGPMPHSNEKIPRKVDGSILMATLNGYKFVVDSDTGGRFVKRYLDNFCAGVPVIPLESGGRYGLQYDAKSFSSLVELVYPSTIDPPESDIVISMMTLHGLSVSGDELVYDGYSPFRPLPLTIDNNVRSDTHLSWKVRFAKKSHAVFRGFMFSTKPDDGMGEVFMLSHIPLLKAPPDVLSDLEEYAADWDPPIT